MNIKQFFDLSADSKFAFSDDILKCLHHIKHDRWNAAHDIADKSNSKFGKWCHALLHRIEGEQWNANYWYRQAGVQSFKGTFEEEWEVIASQYLHD